MWALVVPEAMAYAGIAGVPVQYGLYAVPLAVVGYMVFGTSRQLFVGPSSTVAALSAATVAPLAAAGSDDYIALTVAIAKSYGTKYGYKVSPSQEMIGYGVANIGSGLLQGFTVTGSLSKSGSPVALALLP